MAILKNFTKILKQYNNKQNVTLNKNKQSTKLTLF